MGHLGVQQTSFECLANESYAFHDVSLVQIGSSRNIKLTRASFRIDWGGGGCSRRVNGCKEDVALVMTEFES